MRVVITIIVATGCSSTRADPPRADTTAPPRAGAIAPLAALVAPHKLTFAELAAVENQDIYPHHLGWTATIADLERRFGPVTRIVDRKYFWAAIDGDRCAMFWLGKRLHADELAIAVSATTFEPVQYGHDWCIAMATGGPLPPTTGDGEPSTGFDSPTPD